MTKKIVKFQLDPASLPPLTRQQKAKLASLAAMPDEQIDTSDIAPLTEALWKSATRNPFYRPIKQATTVRIDADVLQWLKSNGKGYQTRINTILRDAMLHQHEAG
jgi:uncharacterized protein (DUF4415 family)